MDPYLPPPDQAPNPSSPTTKTDQIYPPATSPQNALPPIPPQPVNTTPSKGKPILKYAIFVVVALISFVVVSQLLPDQKEKEYKGFVVSRSNYVGNCSDAATKDGRITKAQAEAYCGCVYDTGIERYGGEDFTQKNVDIEKTGQVTPEFNEIVNECAEKLR
jgi:hypothetical protein